MECGSNWVDMNDDESVEMDFDESDQLVVQPQYVAIPPQGLSPVPQTTTPTTTSPSAFSFGASPQPSTTAPTFSFGAPPQSATTPSAFSFGASPQPATTPSFSFGAPPQSAPTSSAPNPFMPPVNSAMPPPLGFPPVQQPAQPAFGGFGASPAYPSPQGLYSAPQAQPSGYVVGAFASPQYQQQAQQKRKQNFKRATTNVISVKLGTLTSDVVVATGDPCFCAKCGAALSAIDISSRPEGQDKETWKCQFCESINNMSMDEEEVPKDESVDYILESATQATSDDSNVKHLLFVIDISGSMCVTTEIDGIHSLKGSESFKKMQALNTEGANQWNHNQKRNVTYVSRLQSVQAAVDSQLETMEKDQPNRRVGLITFNSEVTIYGDGSGSPVVITGDKLHDYNSLLETGKSQKLNKTIKETKAALSSRLYSLEENGPTALGPALVAALGMAGEIRGSEIVVCTDGLANVGVGALDDIKDSEEKRNAVKQFYESVGKYAAEKGVTINVISIEGTDCRLENLGVVSDLSSGEVTVVNPLKIVSEFKSILSLPVIATNVSVKLLLHKGMYVKVEQDESKKESVFTKDIGNVTSESAFTIEYGVKSKEEYIASASSSTGQSEKETKRTTLPFQLQIYYTKLNGSKCVRVISKEQPVTWDRARAEAEANVDVLGLNCVQSTARMAQGGAYTAARFNNLAHQDLILRAAQRPEQQATVGQWQQKGQMLEEELQAEQMQERNEGLYLDSTSSASEDRRDVRGQRRGDKTAHLLWNMVGHKKGGK